MEIGLVDKHGKHIKNGDIVLVRLADLDANGHIDYDSMRVVRQQIVFNKTKAAFAFANFGEEDYANSVPICWYIDGMVRMLEITVEKTNV